MKIRSLSAIAAVALMSFGSITAHATTAKKHSTTGCYETQRGDPSGKVERLAVPCEAGQHGEVRSVNTRAFSFGEDSSEVQRGDPSLPGEKLPRSTK